MKILSISFFALLLLSCGQSSKETTSLSELKNERIIKNTNNMNIKYAYTILYVEDVKKTIEFYKKVFGFEIKFSTPENDYAELLSGETTLAFASVELGKSNFKKGFIESNLKEKPFGINLAFTTENVEKLMEQATKEGAIILEEAIVKPWGQKVGYIKDINGFLVEICTPIPAEK
jgi:uncharacterized glyoxalase superfamily protein PhnB